jgi:hypothetical protein
MKEIEKRQAPRRRSRPVNDPNQTIILGEQIAAPEIAVPEPPGKIRQLVLEALADAKHGRLNRLTTKRADDFGILDS